MKTDAIYLPIVYTLKKKNHGLGHWALGSLIFQSIFKGRVRRSGGKSEGILFVYNRDLDSGSHAFSSASKFLPPSYMSSHTFCLLNFGCTSFPSGNANLCPGVLGSGYEQRLSGQAAQFKSRFLHLLFHLTNARWLSFLSLSIFICKMGMMMVVVEAAALCGLNEIMHRTVICIRLEL